MKMIFQKDIHRKCNAHGWNPHGWNPHGWNPHGLNPHGWNPHGWNPHGGNSYYCARGTCYPSQYPPPPPPRYPRYPPPPPLDIHLPPSSQGRPHKKKTVKKIIGVEKP